MHWSIRLPTELECMINCGFSWRFCISTMNNYVPRGDVTSRHGVLWCHATWPRHVTRSTHVTHCVKAIKIENVTTFIHVVDTVTSHDIKTSHRKSCCTLTYSIDRMLGFMTINIARHSHNISCSIKDDNSQTIATFEAQPMAYALPIPAHDCDEHWE